MFIFKIVVKYFEAKGDRPAFIAYSSKGSYFLNAIQIEDLYPSINGRVTSKIAINKGAVLREINENTDTDEWCRVYQSGYDKGKFKLPKEEGIYSVVCNKLVFKKAEGDKKARLYISDIIEEPMLLTLLKK